MAPSIVSRRVKAFCSIALLRAMPVLVLQLLVAGVQGQDCNHNGVEDSLEIFDQTYRLTVDQRLASGTTPRSIASADFNGDGLLDLFAGNRHSDDFSLSLNRGDGRFASPESFPIRSPAWITVGDFNEDGRVDVVGVSSLSEDISLVLADGSRFAEQVSYPTSRSGWDFVTNGDLDADGHLDLVATNRWSPHVLVLWGSGDGEFEESVEIELPIATNPRHLALLDWRRNGFLDLVVAYEADQSSGTLTRGGLLLVRTNAEERSFRSILDLEVGVNPRWVTATDLNGDEYPDLIWVDHGVPGSVESEVWISWNSETRSPRHELLASEQPSQMGQIAVGTLDDSGVKPEILVLDGADVRMFSVNEAGNYVDRTRLGNRIGNTAQSLTVGDFDGDGQDDVATANSSAARDDLTVLQVDRGLLNRDLDGDGWIDECAERSDRAELSFRGPESLLMEPGATQRVSYEVWLQPYHDPQPMFGINGWSLSIAVDGMTDFELGIDGTASDTFNNGGLLQGGFNQTQLAEKDGRFGAVQAIVLSQSRASIFPLDEALPVLRITGDVTAEEERSLVSLSFEDGFVGRGNPISNHVNISGQVMTLRLLDREVIVEGHVGSFLRGDANGDGSVDISDSIYGLSYLFLGGDEPPCLDAADSDDSGRLDISDAAALNAYLFLGFMPPPSPGPRLCAKDPSEDELSCLIGQCGL